MKKLALLAAILLLFGLTASFAEVGVDVSGSAEATFGYNLEDGGAGFENSEDVSFVVTVIPEQTVASDGMDGWTGYIEFADLSVIADNDDESDYWSTYIDADSGDAELTFLVTLPDVTAKIMNGPMYITIYDHPGFGIDAVDAIEDDEDGDYAAEDEETDLDETRDDNVGPDLRDVGPDIAGGISVGYDTDTFDVEIWLADRDGYEDATDESDDWLFGGMVGVSAAGATVNAYAAMTVDGFVDAVEQNPMYFGAKADYTADLGMATFVPYVGLDYYMSDTVDPGEFEVGGGFDLTFTNDDTIGVDVYYSGADTNVDVEKGLDLEVEVIEDSEAGFIPGLMAEIFFGYYDVGTDVVGGEADMRFALDVSYMVADFEPYAGFDLDNTNTVSVYGAEAGVRYHGIPMTVIDAGWNTSDLENHTGYIEVMAEVEM